MVWLNGAIERGNIFVKIKVTLRVMAKGHNNNFKLSEVNSHVLMICF